MLTAKGEHAGFRWEAWEHVRRSGESRLCGYVFVPPGHPWHGRPCEEILKTGAPGGVTYAQSELAGGGWKVGFDREPVDHDVFTAECRALCERAYSEGLADRPDQIRA